MRYTMSMAELGSAALQELLALADDVALWTTQDTLKHQSAGRKHLIRARTRYYLTKIRALDAAGIAIRAVDCGGCTCGATCRPGFTPSEDCAYHLAARLQPGNHSIPWNCPAYYDGCNCAAQAEPERNR